MSFSFLTGTPFGRFRNWRKPASANAAGTPAPANDGSTCGLPGEDHALDERIARIISEIPRRRVRHQA